MQYLQIHMIQKLAENQMEFWLRLPAASQQIHGDSGIPPATMQWKATGPMHLHLETSQIGHLWFHGVGKLIYLISTE